MLSSTSANVAITDRRVENAYDALGRRVRKTVKFASTGAVIEDRYFIYDGWNVIEETIAPVTGPVETAEAVWGTDLSGTAQGAGGVGGLLLRESSANGASYYHYDGNGNVTALTSGAGTVQAAYTYGPFGETLRAAGPLAQANPWRFSTKYQDDETGLLYYGYRFYNPTDGRWPSRDPIEEDGGINLYRMLANDAVNYGDYLGFGWWDDLWNGTRTCASCAKHFVYDGMGKGGVNQVIGIFDGIGNLVSDPRAAVNAMVGQIQDLVRDVRNGQLDTGTLRAVGLSDLAWAIDNSEGKGEIWWCKWSGRITAELVPYLAGGAVGGKLIGKIQGKLKAKAARTTVLGENMAQRVIPFAEQTGARTIPFGSTADEWASMTAQQRYRLNDGALRARINEGDSFRYIGQDPLRNPALRTQFDLTGSELLRLNSRGIPYETVSPSEVMSVLGRP